MMLRRMPRPPSSRSTASATREIGWACRCGTGRLDFKGSAIACCPACARHYRLHHHHGLYEIFLEEERAADYERHRKHAKSYGPTIHPPRGGFLFVTTPNVSSALSRVMLLCVGHAHFFSRKDYHTSGHISPVPWEILEEHARQTGWQLLETAFAGNIGLQGLHRKAALCLAGLMGTYTSRQEKTFGCTVMVLQKP